MNTYIGIDPSINSTGICIQTYENDLLMYEHFYIIKPNKLTKQEQGINIDVFDYIVYEKLDISKNDITNSHIIELNKTKNMICIAKTIIDIIQHNVKGNTRVIMEGISYGSSQHTKSIYDLAGLNYLIRYFILNIDNVELMICPPQEIKKFASGKGNSQKDILTEAFLILYSQFSEVKKIDDIVDAYFMCKYANNIKQ